MSTITCTNVSTQVEDYLKNFKLHPTLKIFNVPISSYYNHIDWFINHLDDNEKRRAKKFHFTKDTNRFIICRALLKLVLAHHGKLRLSQVKINTDDNGKPYLICHENIKFNISHSDTHALIAIDKNDIGVDIEYLNYEFDYMDLLPHSFGALEVEEIQMSKDGTKTFFKFWTRKEAIVKMTGKGIDDRLNKLQVIDGTNYFNSQFFNTTKNAVVASFVVNDNHIASIAYSNINYITSPLLLFDLPEAIPSLQELIL